MAVPRSSGSKSSTYSVQIWLVINLFEPLFPHLYNNDHPLKRFIVKSQQEVSEHAEHNA